MIRIERGPAQNGKYNWRCDGVLPCRARAGCRWGLLVLDMSDRIFRLLFLSSCGVVLAWGIWTAIFTLYPIMVGLPILH
jgi:hypothetical protein